MVTVPLLTDGVVSLRAHRDADLDRCIEQCTDPLSVAWTTVPTSYTREDAKRFIRHAMPGGWETGQEWGFAVEYDGEYAGTVSLRPEGDGRAEIAYGSHPGVRGMGVMERALRLLLDWGFSADGADLQVVRWCAYQDNWASRRLAWRVGFDIAPGVARGALAQRGQLRDAWQGTLLRDDPRDPRGRWLDVPVIRHGDFTLRPLADADVPRIVEACSDPVSRHWMRRLPDPFLPEDAERWITGRRTGAANGQGMNWAITDPDSDLMLGAVALFDLDFEDGQAELGYWVHPGARGHGVATAGARAAARHGLIDAEDGGLGLLRVHAVAAVDNPASRSALVRAGFHEVGRERSAMLIQGEPADAIRYDLLAADVLAT